MTSIYDCQCTVLVIQWGKSAQATKLGHVTILGNHIFSWHTPSRNGTVSGKSGQLMMLVVFICHTHVHKSLTILHSIHLLDVQLTIQLQ